MNQDRAHLLPFPPRFYLGRCVIGFQEPKPTAADYQPLLECRPIRNALGKSPKSASKMAKEVLKWYSNSQKVPEI